MIDDSAGRTTPPAPLREGDAAGISPETVLPEAAPAPATSGRRLGPFLLLEELGRGGMGVVHRAYHAELDAHFAVKILPGADAGERAERFRREARAAARLRHPGIVSVINVGEDAGSSWLAMELVVGVGLDRAIAAPTRHGLVAGPGGRGLDAATAIRLTREVAAAAHAAHAEGIVHRDLKPANVLVTREGRARVTDFGLARMIDTGVAQRLTRSGMLMGTPAYMSPEQAAGNAADLGPESDVYQIGAILYEMLTGRAPYAGADPLEVVRLVQAADPAPPRQVDPAIDGGAEAICLQAMAREPGERYATAQELAEDCARWESGAPLRARPASTWTRARRGLRRRRTSIVVLASLSAILLLVLSLASQIRERTRTRTTQALRVAVSTVARFQDEILRVEMPREARLALAAQPLQLLEDLRRTWPDLGPAHSWCGHVKALLAGSEQDLADAEADLDRGCALSPGQAVVWYLRGRHRLARYQAIRPLPVPMFSAYGLELAPLPDETPLAIALREGGLADLERLAAAQDADSGFGEEERRLGAALAALRHGGEANCRTALEVIGQPRGREAWLLRGQALYLLLRFEEAAAAFEEAVRSGPQDAEARNLCGLSLAAAGLARSTETGEDPRPWLRRGRTELDAAVRIRPDDSGLLLHRALIHLRMATADAVRGVDPRASCRSAQEDCAAGLRRAPDDAALWGARGIAFLRQAEAEGRMGQDPRPGFASAIADFDEALRRSPGNVEALANRGSARVCLGDAQASRGEDPAPTLDRAIADLDAALGQDPGSSAARRNRGIALMQRGVGCGARGQDPMPWYQRALADLDAVQAEIPTVVGVLQDRSRVLLHMGEAEAARGGDPRPWFDRALADLEETVRRDPDNYLPRQNRAALLVRMAESATQRGEDPAAALARALEDCDALLRLDPDNVATWVIRSGVHVRRGAQMSAHGVDPRPAYREALADAGEALRRNPENFAALVNRATAGRLLGEAQAARQEDPLPALERAAADLTEVIRRNPGNPGAHRDRGIARTALAAARHARGEDPRSLLEEACADLAEAIRLEPAHPSVRMHRAAALLQLGAAETSRNVDATSAYQRALADCEDTLRTSPGNREALNLRGAVRLRQAQLDQSAGRDPQPAWDRAAADFRAAADAGHSQALFNLGNLHVVRRQYEEAIQAFEEAARRMPQLAAMARSRVQEILQWKAQQELRALAPDDRRWAVDLIAAHAAIAGGQTATAARSVLERALAAADECLSALPEQARLERAAAPARRALLARSHYRLARILSLASVGKDAPAAESRAVSPEDAADLRTRAFDHLRSAAELDGPDRAAHEGEADFVPLRDDPRWRETLERLR